MYFRLPLRDLWLRRERKGGHQFLDIRAVCHGLKLSRRVSGSNESGKLYRLELFFEGIEDDLQD